MPEEEVLDLRRKFGFLEIGMKHNVPVVPCYTFNEVDHFSQVSYWDIKERHPFAFWLRLHFQYLFGIIFPFMKNVFPVGALGENGGHITVVGKPLRLHHTKEPSDAELQESMRKYIDALQELHDTYAPLYSSRARKMVIM